MRTTQVHSNEASGIESLGRVDMKLEVVVIPVSDVDRAKRFYGSLGWRLDADIATGDDFRCSNTFVATSTTGTRR